MEQRKVLFIIISITVILAATIGVGLLLFYPREDAPEATAEIESWDPMDFLAGSGSRPGLGVAQSDTAADDADGEGDVSDSIDSQDGAAGEDPDGDSDGPFSVTYGVREQRGTSDDSAASGETRPAVTIVETEPEAQSRTTESIRPTQEQNTASPAPERTSGDSTRQPDRRAPAVAATTEQAPAVREEATLASRAYWVQLISSPNRDTVEQAQRSLGEHQVHTRIQTKEIGETIYYRLRLGPFAVREEAEKFLDWMLELDRFADALIFVDYTTSVRAPAGS
jgi:cell division septation protein DedD